jgi:C4-dicarboxylate-specific signal transduction histidine kinase
VLDNQHHRFWHAVAQCLAGSIALALLTFVCFRLQLNLATTESLYLIVVVLLSLQGSFLSSAVVSLIATGCLDYYFAPPIFSLRISDPINVVSITAFLTISAVITRLVSRVRRLMQEKLQQSEAYLSEAQRLSHTGSFGWRISTGELLWSEETFRIFQYERTTKPTVQRVLQRAHPEDAAQVRQTIERASKDGRDFDFEHRLLMPDGSVKYVHVVAHALSDKSGGMEFVGAVMDVTVVKEAEARIRQAQADLAHVNRVTTMGELTASLAHEVNQPIAAALTNANTCLLWLAGNTPNIEEARAAAMRIVTDRTRAAEIASRVRLLFEKGTPPREWVDVNELIREMLVLLRNEATRYAISVRTELAADLPQVMGDRVQLQQVLMNLITNGIDAMKDVHGTRELAITSRRAETEDVLVSVSDTGVGLPPQRADQIFNAFFTTKLHGTGMGLSISRSLVQSHSGRLWAADNASHGASFHLTLPTAAEAHE